MGIRHPTVSNDLWHDFVRRLPSAHVPCGTNAKNQTRDRRLGVVWLVTCNRNRWKKSAAIDTVWVTWRDRDGGEQTALEK